MVLTHIRQIQQGRTYIYIPSEFRDKYNITPDTKPNIENIKGRLIITFSGE
jgi:bifunctional DNA-binding transcriptional regulator/antitoxin component of YhaV-PrlF toxin-antitoxin module